jgi:hypothetical protein
VTQWMTTFMRTNPGPVEGVSCRACRGQMMAVRCGWALLPECNQCGMTPADAYFALQMRRLGEGSNV